MADYYPVLTRAIAALEQNTADTRRAIYERARQAIVKQLRSYDPPLSESEITKERLGLEEAVRKIESEYRAAQQAPKPPPPPISARTPPPPPSSAPRSLATPVAAPPLSMPSSPAAPVKTPAQPVSPSMRMGGEGLVKVHAAAAAAASLGAATANAQAAAGATKAAFEPPPQPRATPPRLEPSFERPRVPGPLPEPRPDPAMAGVAPEDDPNPHLREPEYDAESDIDRPRAPAIGGLVAIILILGLGIGAYLARDQIYAMFGSVTQTAATDTGPKVDDRVTPSDTAPGTVAEPQQQAPDQTAAAPGEPAPAAPTADSGSLVSQRAILYDEAPDQQGGAASSGSVVWRTEPVPGKPDQIQLVGEASVPERGLAATMTFTRNTDETLTASHLIEIKFDLADDFQNGGVANVPGILFKPTEEAGGSALKGMSVKVTKNLFWIGLEKTPADREQNMQAIRTRGWIDLPILYENGRRAVLTIEKGPPGERAFETAFSTWDAQATATPAAEPHISSPPPEAPAPAPVLPP